MAFEKIKKFIGDDETVKDSPKADDYYKVTTKNAFKDMSGAGGSKMVLVEPRAYSESQQIADYLRLRKAVIVNLRRVTPDQAKRIIDFLSGTLYAINGNLEKIGNGIFLCTPDNVGVEGKIEEKQSKKSKEIEEDE